MAPSILGSALSDSLWQAEQTPWGMSASAVSQAAPALYNPMASNSRNFWMTLGGGILGTVLAGLGRNQADERNAELYGGFQRLEQATSDAERQAIVKEFPRLTNVAFAMRNQENDLNNQIRVERAKRIAELFKENEMVEIEGRKEGEKTRQRIAAESQAGGFNSPAEKELTRIQTFFEGLPEVKDYMMVNKTVDALSAALKDPGGVSGPEIAKLAVRAIEPGLAALQGEADALEASTAIDERVKSQLRSMLAGDSKMNEQTRAEIARLAARAYRSHADMYNQSLTSARNEVRMKGLPSGMAERVGRFGVAKPYEEKFGDILKDIDKRPLPTNNPFSAQPGTIPAPTPTPPPGQLYRMGNKIYRIVPKK